MLKEDGCVVCDVPCGIKFTPHPDQPYTHPVPAVDGVQVVPMIVPKANTYIPQHTHKYDHLTLVAVGQVSAWADKEFLGTFRAPSAIHIKAGVAHTFKTLVNDCVLYCCHRIDRTGKIESVDNNHLVEGVGGLEQNTKARSAGDDGSHRGQQPPP